MINATKGQTFYLKIATKGQTFYLKIICISDQEEGGMPETVDAQAGKTPPATRPPTITPAAIRYQPNMARPWLWR